MNAQQTTDKAVIRKETKNKIRADFDRTPLKERLKARWLSPYFLTQIIYKIFRLVLMIGISYIVLYPFITKIAGSFMGREDFVDLTVQLIPKNFSLDIYKAIFTDLNYWGAFLNTFLLSFIAAILQTFTCCLIGYGFAKFKFRGRNILFMLVILTMVIPHQNLSVSMESTFQSFDLFGIVRLLKGGGIEIFGWNIKDIGPGVASFFENLNILPDAIPWGGVDKFGNPNKTQAITVEGISLMNTYIPMVMLSIGGLAFKNGLYVFLLRQFFRGVPDELEESAYMDGSGPFRTFLQVILPLSVPMMITVFLFAFCWQWTDDFYISRFFKSNDSVLLPKIIGIPSSLNTQFAGQSAYETAIINTCGLVIIAPLIILYVFCQNFLVQGIEQSGLAN